MIDTHAYSTNVPLMEQREGCCVFCPASEPEHDPDAVWNPTGGLVVPRDQLPPPSTDWLLADA